MIRNFYIVLLIFSGVLIGASAFLGGLSSTYDISVEDVSTLNVVSQIQADTNNLQAALNGTGLSIPILDVPYTIVAGGYQLLNIILVGIPSLWFSFLNDMGIFLGIPGWFTGIVVTIFVIILVFEIISIVMKWKT